MEEADEFTVSLLEFPCNRFWIATRCRSVLILSGSQPLSVLSARKPYSTILIPPLHLYPLSHRVLCTCHHRFWSFPAWYLSGSLIFANGDCWQLQGRAKKGAHVIDIVLVPFLWSIIHVFIAFPIFNKERNTLYIKKWHCNRVGSLNVTKCNESTQSTAISQSSRSETKLPLCPHKEIEFGWVLKKNEKFDNSIRWVTFSFSIIQYRNISYVANKNCNHSLHFMPMRQHIRSKIIIHLLTQSLQRKIENFIHSTLVSLLVTLDSEMSIGELEYYRSLSSKDKQQVRISLWNDRRNVIEHIFLSTVWKITNPYRSVSYPQPTHPYLSPPPTAWSYLRK